MSIPFYKPSPAPPGVFKGQPLPYRDATFLSKLFTNWLGPMMKVAWSRTIEADDLWDLTEEMQAKNLANKIEAHFVQRLPPSRRDLHVRPPVSSTLDPVKSEEDLHAENVKNFGKKKAKKIQEGQLAVEDGKLYDMSLIRACIASIRWELFRMGCLKLVGNLARTLAPLVTNIFLTQLSLAYAWHQAVKARTSTADLVPPQSVGYMLGVAFGLWALSTTASIVFYYAFWYESLWDKLLRSGLISMISRKSTRLSRKARLEMTNGGLTTMISVDASRLEQGPVNLSLIAMVPTTIILAVGLLINLLGPSALVGLAVLLVAGPFKVWAFNRLAALRKGQNEIIDQRVRLLSEILNNIRTVKLYAYEWWFIKKIGALRQKELVKLRQNNLTSAVLTSSMAFIPTLAAILTFITYGLSGNQLTVPLIFSSLQFFNVLRNPIYMLPSMLTGLSDAMVALRRIKDLLLAEELETNLCIDETAQYAIDVQGDFQFETASPTDLIRKSEKEDNEQAKPVSSDDPNDDKDKAPFALRDINLHIPRGSLVCVVGRIGVGKTALLSGLINEMKQISGHVVFGGSVSYVPQQAWVQSGSIRDNITFSAEPEDVDLQRVQEIIDACGLRADINMWSEGDLTKIGERGITLSGDQRQRICIARAAYQQSDVVRLDDPLSAVDAHVGYHLLHHCIVSGPMADRTRVLVTHQMDVLPLADVVLVMDQDEQGDGGIIQQGTYDDLLNQEGIFKTLVEQYGTVSRSSSEGTSQLSTSSIEDSTDTKQADIKDNAEDPKLVNLTVEKHDSEELYMDEERFEGAVSMQVYTRYVRSVGSWLWPVVCAFFFVAAQGATVFNTLFLGFWSGDELGLSQGAYMVIYGGLGAGMAISTWAATFGLFLAGIRASFTMFSQAWVGVMRSPTTWHDRTPTGRIISRLSKDIEILDDEVATSINSVLTGLLSVLASLGLVLYIYPYAGLLFIPILMYDYLTICYYRQTTREIKRLTSILRSDVYTNFGEQLAGLPVIRAFHQQKNFEKRLDHAVDVELCATLCGTTSQGRWLGVRVSISSYLLVLIVALMGVGFRNTVAPSKPGVVLTYMIATTSTLTGMVEDITGMEAQMNTVERVQYYAALTSEAALTLPSDPAAEIWPTKGQVTFDSVQLRYRPNLPVVLKDLSFSVRPGEKVGVIGRTGAGKSSLAQALFRMVELCWGKVEIDGVDLSMVGLDTLRQRLAIIPQDTFLFGGSVRENMDPTGSVSDADLNAALNLIHRDPDASASLREKFRLDGVVANEGSNFSAGEKQLRTNVSCSYSNSFPRSSPCAPLQSPPPRRGHIFCRSQD